VNIHISNSFQFWVNFLQFILGIPLFMPYEILYFQEDDILFFQVHGNNKGRDSIDLWQLVQKQLQKHQVFKVVVELHLVGALDNNFMVVSVSLLNEIFSQSKAKIAVVDHNSTSVVQNRLRFSLLDTDLTTEFAVFDNLIEASQWLK